MADPFTISLILAAGKVADDLTGKVISEAIGGTIGNVSDRLLQRAVRRAVDIVRSKPKPGTANLDLLKALRRAQLKATDDIRIAMKSANSEPEFPARLKTWIVRETDRIENIEEWINWEMPAAKELEKLINYTQAELDIETRLSSEMTLAWENYLRAQPDTEIAPDAFWYFLSHSWNSERLTLTWASQVGEHFKVYLREAATPEARQAEKAFVHNFLAELKIDLTEVKRDLEELKNLPAQVEEIKTFLLSEYAEARDEIHLWASDMIASQQDVIRKQQEIHNRDSRSIASLTDTIASQQKTIVWLQDLLDKKPDDKELKKQLEEAQINSKQFQYALKTLYEMHPAFYAEELKTYREIEALEIRVLGHEARKTKRRQMEEAEDSADAADSHALAHLKEEKVLYAEAQFYFRRATELQPKNSLYINDLGYFCLQMGLYEESITILTEALLHLNTMPEPEQLKRKILNNIGSGWKAKGHYDKAIDYYERALEIDEKIYPQDLPSIATRYNNIGNALNAKGHIEKSIDYFEKALTILKNALGSEHPKVAITNMNLGSAYKDMQQYEIAFEYYEKALTIFKHNYGPENPNIAKCYNNMGEIWQDKKLHDKALEYHEMALIIDENVYGIEHPDTAIDYNNIGVAWQNKGDDDKAIEYFERALIIVKKVYGNEHPNTAIEFNNLGISWSNKGEYDKAIEYYEMALKILIDFLGEDHPSTKKVKENLQQTRRAKG